jgi:dihydrolipoamide dehydrogenase
LIATAEVMTEVNESAELGLRFGARDSADPGAAPQPKAFVNVDLAAVNQRVLALAKQQSADICDRVLREQVELVIGRGRLDGPDRVIADTADGERSFDAEMILLATGAHPRELPEAQPDGERILTWTQVYGLTELPKRLIVVGSGVTGASSPARTTPWAARSSWCRPGTGCCPARTPTPPRCSRTCSPGAA